MNVFKGINKVDVYEEVIGIKENILEIVLEQKERGLERQMFFIKYFGV